MKTYLNLALRGRDWWGAFLIFWVLFWVFYVPLLLVGRMSGWSREQPGLVVLLVVVCLLGIIVVTAVFSIVCMRIIVPKISVDGNSFGFHGSIGRYLWLSVSGILLSIVTLTVYLPWYLKRITAYVVSQVSFKGSTPEFLGRGGKLFKYLVLALWIPVAVLIALVVVFVGLNATNAANVSRALTPAVAVVELIVLVPWMYLTYKWYVNIRWNEVAIAWRTTFWASCGFILGQLLLTLITLSIYWPAATLRIYRYFSERTLLTNAGGVVGRLGFDGSIGKGFGLLWGQALLSIITLGIYVPWAYARIGRWLLGATYYEPAAGPAATSEH